MNALKPRAPFQVLVMSEKSRLGRGERTLDSVMDKVMLSLTNFAAEMEREKAHQRTRDAMQRKAARGQVAGGSVYGYRNREITRVGADGRQVRDHVVREIHEEQAVVIRRIFEGSGYSRIAKAFNAEGIPSSRRRRGWATSGVRELVLRDLYRSRVVWGKTRWADRGGTKIKVDVPEGEWIVQRGATTSSAGGSYGGLIAGLIGLGGRVVTVVPPGGTLVSGQPAGRRAGLRRRRPTN